MSDSDGDILEGGGIEYTVVEGDNLSKICEKHPELKYATWQELLEANKKAILDVGRAKMVALGVPATTSTARGQCWVGVPAYKNSNYHKEAQYHYLSQGIHYDGPGQPTIYPGTTFFIKENTDPPTEEESEATNPEEPEQPDKTKVDSATNSISTGVFSQYPIPRLELYEFKDNALKNYLTYDGEAQDTSKQLLSYQFSEAVDEVRGSFSFTVENETDGGGNTAFDTIKLRSIVKLYEGEEKPCFIGVIRRKSMSNMMSAQGPKKTITFSGCSLMGLVADFVLSLDIKIMNVADAGIVSKQLTIKLIEATTIAEFLKITLDAYIKLTIRTFTMNDSETINILKALTNDSLDLFTHGTHDGGFQYHISNAFYSQGQNNIVTMWQNILPNPLYELYGYCSRDGAMKIMAREAPFDPKPWAGLRCTKVEPISLKNYALQQSDEEVYTVFNCWLEGSAMGHDFYTAVNQHNGNEDTLVIDADKLKRYGYRPLEIAFRGYDRSQNTKKDTSALTGKFKGINERAARWYARLDEMLSGTITIVTNFVEPQRNPRIGEKVSFLGGELYVKGVAHAWNYGGNPSIDLTVSRGAVYNNGSMIAGEKGRVTHIGEGMRELAE